MNLYPVKILYRRYCMKTEGNENFIEKIRKEWAKAPQKLSSLFIWMQDDIQKYVMHKKFEGKEAQMISTTKIKSLQTLVSRYLNKIKLKSPYITNSSWNSGNIISKTIIDAKTKKFISLVRSGHSSISLQKRLENLTSHLKEYPEAKISAVKEGVIPLLIHLRRIKEDDEELQAELRESLSLLGYMDSLPNKGIRILSIDGGGTRGLIALEMLKKLEELTGKHTHQLFDLICGVSTGAIIACLLGVHKKSTEECSAVYKELSAKIFSQSPLWGTRNLVLSHSYYDSKLFDSLLKDVIGNTPLIKTSRDSTCPKLAIVSTVVNKPQILAYVFRNYELPYGITSHYLGSSHVELWKAVRASSAAPSYFEDFRIGEFIHQDGGVLLNNPAAVAIHEARLLWPDSSLHCILSLGTGRKKYAEIHQINSTQVTEFDPDIETDKNLQRSQKKTSTTETATSWKTTLLKILDSATDTEGVHTILRDLLPKGVYYRFNPLLTGDMAMDDTQPEFINQLEIDARTYIQHNELSFEEVAAALLTPKSMVKKGMDWLKMKHLEGLKSLLATPRQR